MTDEGKKWVLEDKEREGVFLPSQDMKEKAHISDNEIYKEAKKNPIKFWKKRALKEIDWFKEFETAYREDSPYFHWFEGGETNICYNALDRHLPEKKDKEAIIWVPEDPDQEERRIIESLLDDGIPKTHIREYINRYDFL